MTGSFDDDKSDPLEGLSTDFASLLRTVARDDFAALPPLGTVVGNKYELTGILGQGGMGVVYSARHRLTGKLFAIKWLLPDLSEKRDAVERFIREAIAAGKVEHPNVVEIYDVDQHESSHYMVMQLVQGETLAQRLNQRAPLGHVEACRILIQVMRGLAAVHAEGIIHRDLKPQNIIIARTKQGEELPKVLDFGISKILPKLDELSLQTHSGHFMMGTPSYMAPEQLRQKPVDPRTDVYALGVIAYQMISGRLPFTADNIPDLICKVMGDRPALLTETPLALSQIIARALSLQPEERFASVEALAAAMEPFAGGTSFKSERLDEISVDTPASAPPVELAVSTTALLATESAVPGRRKVRLPGGWVAAGVALVLGVGAVVVLATQRGGASTHAAAAHAAAARAPAAAEAGPARDAPAQGFAAEPTQPAPAKPAQGFAAEPAQAPAAEPAQGFAAEPAQAPAAEPAQEPAQPAAAEPVQPPAAVRSASPVQPTAARPATKVQPPRAASRPKATPAQEAPPQPKVQRITGGDMDESDNE